MGLTVDTKSAAYNAPVEKTKSKLAAKANSIGENLSSRKISSKNNGNMTPTRECSTSPGVSSTVKYRTDDFFEATNGIGTKNRLMEKVLNDSLNDDTFVDLALYWNKKYAGVHGDSLIEAFMDDADHGQAEKYLPKIADNLFEQAEKLGVCDEEFRRSYQSVVRQLGYPAIIGMDDKLICENIDRMISKISKVKAQKSYYM